MDDKTVKFIVDAVKLVADNGWKLLPMYRLDTETGEWTHYKNLTFVDREWLSDFDFFENQNSAEKDFETIEKYCDILKKAESVFENSIKNSPKLAQQLSYGDIEDLRWWLHPVE